MDPALLAAAGTGLVAGGVHVVSGADHLAALLPLSVGRGPRAWALGARWGAGHSAGVVIVGLAALLLRERIDVDALGGWGESLVGAMLIGLGALGVRAALRDRIHAHEHAHGGDRHVHLHLHPAGGHPPGRAPSHAHGHAALFAGVLHGVAGTSHLLGVLPAVALATRGASLSYLGAFGAGTVIAMAAFAGAVGAGSARWGSAAPARVRRLRLAASWTCVGVGCAWLALPALGYALP